MSSTSSWRLSQITELHVSQSGGYRGGLSMLGQHIFAGERLQAFSDAVFAVIATIMIIPLKLDDKIIQGKGGLEDFPLENYLYNQYPKYLIYIFSFIVVVDAWYSHVRIFSIVEQVDDVILWLNLICLLLIGFLPFSIGLVSRFQESRPEGFHLAISMSSFLIILIGVTMILILVYAFRRQSLLHPEIAHTKEIALIKKAMYISLLVNPILALLAFALSFITNDIEISLVFFYPIGSASTIVRVAFYIYYKWKNLDLPEHATALFRTVANKVRTEAFSDGIFSIAATLIILDLTTEDLPTEHDVKHMHRDDLSVALKRERNGFMSYISSFLIVGLLWFVQYGMFQFINKVTPAISFMNTLTLSLVCGIPFVAGVNIIFADSSNYDNMVLSIRAVAVLVFLIGVSQLLMWTIALLTKERCLNEEVDKYPAETLQFFKIMVFPTASFIVYCATFSTHDTAHTVYHTVTYLTPFIFLILNVIFKWQQGCTTAVKHKISEAFQEGEKSLLLQGEARVVKRPTNQDPHELLLETTEEAS